MSREAPASLVRSRPPDAICRVLMGPAFLEGPLVFLRRCYRIFLFFLLSPILPLLLELRARVVAQYSTRILASAPLRLRNHISQGFWYTLPYPQALEKRL